MISAITFNGLKISEYSPNLIKSSVTGHGHTDKEGMQKWISLEFGIEQFQTDDESDALAIGLCHWYQSQHPSLKQNVKTKSRSLKNSLAHKIMENKL